MVEKILILDGIFHLKSKARNIYEAISYSGDDKP
jgi:hypothetical protein